MSPFKLKKTIWLLVTSTVVVLAGMSARCVFAEENKYFIAGKEYREQGNIDAAIESFKKVLYVERNHSRASWQLAEIYEKKGEFRKAVKEYHYFLMVAKDDTNLSDEKRKELYSRAEEKIARIEGVKKEFPRRYQGALSLYERMTLLLSVLITMLLLVKLSSSMGGALTQKIEEQKKEKIWVDPYWKNRTEREIVRFPFSISHAIAYILIIIVYIIVIRLIMMHGFEPCYRAVIDTIQQPFSFLLNT